MPGNGTFNLTALWRALGIKNPRPQMFESVQPVINVGRFHNLVPAHRPPTAAFGGDVPLVAAQFSIAQMISRGPGGAFLRMAGSSTTNGPWIVRTPLAGLVEVSPSAILSREAPLSSMQRGNLVGAPGVATASPSLPSSSFNVFPNGGDLQLWIPHGMAFVVWNPAIGFGMSDVTFVVEDVPAPENE